MENEATIAIRSSNQTSGNSSEFSYVMLENEKSMDENSNTQISSAKLHGESTMQWLDCSSHPIASPEDQNDQYHDRATANECDQLHSNEIVLSSQYFASIRQEMQNRGQSDIITVLQAYQIFPSESECDQWFDQLQGNRSTDDDNWTFVVPALGQKEDSIDLDDLQGIGAWARLQIPIAINIDEV